MPPCTAFEGEPLQPASEQLQRRIDCSSAVASAACCTAACSKCDLRCDVSANPAAACGAASHADIAAAGLHQVCCVLHCVALASLSLLPRARMHACTPCPPPARPQKCEDRFAKSKMVHSIMRHVAETTGSNLEQLYTEVAWPLYRLYGHAHTAFALMITDAESEAVWKRLVDEAHGGTPPPVLTQAVKDGILANIRCGVQGAAGGQRGGLGAGRAARP